MKTKSLKKNFAYNLFYQLLNILIPIITAPYISRTIGPSGVGLYSFYYSVAYYFVIFIMLGLNNYGNRTMAENRDSKVAMSRNFWEIYSTQLFLGIMLFSLYVGYTSIIATDKSAALILGMYVLSGIFDINWFFYGLEEFSITVSRNIIIKLISTIIIFVFVRSENDVYIYCAIMAGSILLSQIIIWPFLFKKVCFIKPTISGIKKHIKPNLILFITVLAVSLFKIMDKIMLGMMSTLEHVGFYESSEKIINIPIVFVTALGTVMLPRVTNMIAHGENNDSRIIMGTSFFSMCVTVPMCFGLMAVSEIFIPLFYGPGYEQCVILYKILLPSCIFLAFANVIRMQYLIPHKMDKEYVVSAFVGAGINLIANTILIPKFASVGAAIGTLLAEISVCIYQCIMVNKHIPVKSFALKSIPPVIAGMLMYFAVSAINFGCNTTIELILRVITGALLYCILLIILMMFRKKSYFDIIRMIRHVK